MRVLFEGEMHVHYGFLNLHPLGDLDVATAETRGGQVNGLLGAGHPGALAMVTGLHTGDVPVRVELHDTEPPLSPGWEDVVEASFTPADDEYGLSAFEQFEELDGVPAVPLRARWHASGMDAAHAADVRMDGEPAIDRYLLQLWPAPPTPDAVLSQASDHAAYWHREAASTPPPPPPPTSEELAERAAREERKRVVQEERRRAEFERERWGGAPPTDELRRIGTPAMILARIDRALTDRLAALSQEDQRVIAVRAARRTCEVAGVLDRPAVREAFNAAARGEPLPEPWHDWREAYDALQDRPAEWHFSFARVTSGNVEPEPISPDATAVTAVRALDGAPPVAVMEAVAALAHGTRDRAGALALVGSWLPASPPAG